MKPELAQENIVVPKETFQRMMNDFSKLVEDFEQLSEAKIIKIAENRLLEIKEKKVSALGEKDFSDYLKKREFHRRKNNLVSCC